MFCENCGQSISETVAQCPYCHQDTGLTATPTGAGSAAAPVRAPANPGTRRSAPSRLTRAEQTVYFRVARGFSWFLLIVTSIGIIITVILLVPVLSQTFGSSTSVSPQELTQASSASQRGFGEESPEINPGEMARLDQAAYEIIQLFPADVKANANIDFMRGQIKGSAANLEKDRKEQLAILEELRDDLKALPEAQRMNAYNNYLNVKSHKIQLDRAKKEEAKQSLVILGTSLFSSIALLTFMTMILVLLSIERNTRLSAA